MQLNTFVQNYLDAHARLERDFTGPRGWVRLTNLVLKKYERMGWFSLDRRKEIGVEVQDEYWITIPSDCRIPERIFVPPLDDYRQMDREYQFDIVNSKIKMKTPFDKKASPDSFTLSNWAADGVSINDDDGTEDQYKDWLLVVSNGDLSGTGIVVASNTAAAGGLTALSFYHDHGSAASTSTAGYMTDYYLMFRYMATFTGLTSQTDEIPIDDRFEDVLAQSLKVARKSRKDSDFKIEYDLEQVMIEEVNNELFDLSEGTRIRPRLLPGLESGLPESDFEYIGNGEDE